MHWSCKCSVLTLKALGLMVNARPSRKQMSSSVEHFFLATRYTQRATMGF